MTETAISNITLALLIGIPLVFFLLHIFLSLRKKWFWSGMIPVLWTALGTWMMVSGYQLEGFAEELFFFFLAGDTLFVITSILLRKYRMKNRS